MPEMMANAATRLPAQVPPKMLLAAVEKDAGSESSEPLRHGANTAASDRT